MFDVTDIMSSSAKYSAGQTVGIKADLGGTSATLTYEPYTVIQVKVAGTTASAMKTAGYFYEIQSKKSTNKTVSKAESLLCTWASARTIAKAYASTWVSAPTVYTT